MNNKAGERAAVGPTLPRSSMHTLWPLSMTRHSLDSRSQMRTCRGGNPGA